LPEHLFAGNAEIGLRRAIDVGEPPALIQRVEGLADSFKNDGQPRIDLGPDGASDRIPQSGFSAILSVLAILSGSAGGCLGDQGIGELLQVRGIGPECIHV
jgi:hypothetical protein